MVELSKSDVDRLGGVPHANQRVATAVSFDLQAPFSSLLEDITRRLHDAPALLTRLGREANRERRSLFERA